MIVRYQIKPVGIAFIIFYTGVQFLQILPGVWFYLY